MAGAAAEAKSRLAEGHARRRAGDLDAATRCFFDAVTTDPLCFDAGVALAGALAIATREGRPLPPWTPVPMGRAPSFSIVVCSHRPQRFAQVARLYQRLFAGLRCEIAGIHDARSLCEGYTRGLRATRGEVVVLSHDDVDVLFPDFAARLVRALARFDVVGVAGSTRVTGPAWNWTGHPHVHGWVTHRPGGQGDWRPGFWSPWPGVAGAAVLDGVFIAAHRRVFEAVPFDAATFDGFHGYDVDFSYRAARAGMSIGVVGALGLVHESLGAFDARWQGYADRFVAKFPECGAPPAAAHHYEVPLASPALAAAYLRRLEALGLERLAAAGGKG